MEGFSDKLTPRQVEAWKLLKGHSQTMLYGGARSGKTLLIICNILLRAMAYPGSRHLIARLRYAHARASVWMDTLPFAVHFLGIENIVRFREQDHFIEITHNGKPNSEVWVDGLDDKDRVDKILGREYVTIFLNEVSQIPYSTVTTVLTRLAQKVGRCKPSLYLDENPPSKFHWTNKLFVQGIDPETGEPVDMSDRAAMQINPDHNRENLPPGYIENTLANLPESKRKRFYLGEFGDTEGVIFSNWDVIPEIPETVRNHSRLSYGLDFGFSVDPAAVVEVRMNGDDLYIDEHVYETGLTNAMLAGKLKGLGIKGPIIADSSEPKSIRELQHAGLSVRAAVKGPDSVRQGIDWLLSKRIHVTRRSASLQSELTNYCWRENREGKPMPEPIDDFNHAIDALRYAVEPWKSATSVYIGRAGAAA